MTRKSPGRTARAGTIIARTLGLVVLGAVLLIVGTVVKANRDEDAASDEARHAMTSSAHRYFGLVRQALEQGPVGADRLRGLRTRAWQGAPEGGLAQGLGWPGVAVRPGHITLTIDATETYPTLGGSAPEYATFRCDFVRRGTRIVGSITEIDGKKALPPIDEASRLSVRL